MEEKIINMNQFLGAAQGDQEHTLSHNMIGSVPVRLIKKLSASLGDRIAFAISFCPFLSAGKVFHGYEDCSVSLLNP